MNLARQLAAGASSANTVLSANTTKITIRAVTAAIRYVIGVNATQTANASTSHFIAQNERLTLDISRNSNIAVIRDASTDGVLELSELN